MSQNANVSSGDLEFQCFAADLGFWKCGFLFDLLEMMDVWMWRFQCFTAYLDEGSNVCSVKEVLKQGFAFIKVSVRTRMWMLSCVYYLDL